MFQPEEPPHMVFKLAELPSLNHVHSILNVLQTLMDCLSPQNSESLEVAQLSNDIASLNISGANPALQPISPPPPPQFANIESADVSRPEQLDSRSAKALTLARALTAKLQRHLRREFALINYEAVQHSTIPLATRPGHSLRFLCLVFTPEGRERARAHGAQEVEGNALTLGMTEQLINLAYHHVSQSQLEYEHGETLRFVTEIVLLRVAALLRNDLTGERARIFTDCPVRAVELPDEDLNHAIGGVVDYVLAKYKWHSPTLQALGSEDIAEPQPIQQLGGVNIFYAESRSELEYGLRQCVLTTEALCRQSGGEEGMRGVVTNGEHWIFFAYKRCGEDGHPSFARSESLGVGVGGCEDHLYVGVILGLLLDWVENPGECDSFEYFEDPGWW